MEVVFVKNTNGELSGEYGFGISFLSHVCQLWLLRE